MLFVSADGVWGVVLMASGAKDGKSDRRNLAMAFAANNGLVFRCAREEMRHLRNDDSCMCALATIQRY